MSLPKTFEVIKHRSSSHDCWRNQVYEAIQRFAYIISRIHEVAFDPETDEDLGAQKIYEPARSWEFVVSKVERGDLES